MEIDPIDLSEVAKQAAKSPTHVGTDYSAEEVDFMLAIDQYKRVYRRPFPTSKEVLAVVKTLGYRKTGQAIPPKPSIILNRRRFKKGK